MIALTSILTIFVGATFFPYITNKIGRKSFLVAALLLAVIGGIFVSQENRVTTDTWRESLVWIPQIGLNFDFRIDMLSFVMSLIALFIGSLVMAFSYTYFADSKKPLGSVGGQLLAFAGAMLGLVTTDNLILLFVFWELTTILSYMLIAFDREKVSARQASMKALMVTTVGGLTMLAGFIALGEHVGSYSIQGIIDAHPSGSAVNVTAWCIALGAISKSALIPMHFWLPAAMKAPTPVSAYLHAAAMVNAGVYLIQRISIVFAGTPGWQLTMMLLGLVTLIFAGYQMLLQVDMKLILAYGTVAQLGLLGAIAAGVTAQLTLAFMAILLSHSLYKAALFMWVGVIDHEFGTRDIRELGRLKQRYPTLFWAGAINGLSMAAIFPMFSFIAKEAGFAGLEHAGSHGTGILLLTLAGIGSALTFAASIRFIYAIYGGFSKTELRRVKRIRLRALLPTLTLTIITLSITTEPKGMSRFLDAYSNQFEGNIEALTWFHGINGALITTIFSYIIGSLIFVYRGKIRKIFCYKLPYSAAEIYQGTVNNVEEFAGWVTAKTQRGSLPFYLSVILMVALVLPGSYLIYSSIGSFKVLNNNANIIWADNSFEIALMIVGIVSAVLTVFARKRFAAILFASLSGYSLALIFSLYGAPDLALTQMTVETISLVTFVLGLRLLPPQLWLRFKGENNNKVRIVIAVAFALAIGFYTFVALGARLEQPVSNNFFKLAYEQGGGYNVVNVTLVDIRAWDTFGEITVLTAAATGVASLIFIQRRERTGKRAGQAEKGMVDRTAEFSVGSTRLLRKLAKQFNGTHDKYWLSAVSTLAPERRSVIFEITVRMIFHSMVVLSIFLLLAGHDQPGGGFAGGLLAGIALTIRYLAGGRYELTETVPLPAGLFLGSGLALAAITGFMPLFFGQPIFSSTIWEFTLPILGHLKLVSATFFDIGVYLVVIGLVLDILRSLGSEIDSHAENDDIGTSYDSVDPDKEDAKLIKKGGSFV
ncbi:MAG: Na+/H+ antiporter subunit A [Micrococcaceae bacterium]